ncbi:hypothetical protein FRB90_007030, partial [Tulasnella sp. 427]
ENYIFASSSYQMTTPVYYKNLDTSSSDELLEEIGGSKAILGQTPDFVQAPRVLVTTNIIINKEQG